MILLLGTLSHLENKTCAPNNFLTMEDSFCKMLIKIGCSPDTFTSTQVTRDRGQAWLLERQRVADSSRPPNVLCAQLEPLLSELPYLGPS